MPMKYQRYVHKHLRTMCKIAHAQKKARTHKINSYMHVWAHMFMNFFMVLCCHFVNLSIKFPKDPTISWEDIPLFVTLYNFEN